MKREYLIAGLVCIIFAGLAGADYLATSISTDGSVMLTTSGSYPNGSFSSRAMALDSAHLVRTFPGDESGEDLVVSASGPVLFSDYASASVTGPEIMDHCMFLKETGERSLGEASVFTSGILHGGEYEISRDTGSDFSGETQVNGSGLLAFGFQGLWNRTLDSRGFVSGNMSVQDLFRYGGRV